MTISSAQTLIIFFSIFGIIGSIRGPNREVWTLGGIALTLALLSFAGSTFFSQLPIRVGSGAMALVGNQDASDKLYQQQLGEPWSNLILLGALIALIWLAYFMGQRFGGKVEPTTFGERISGFIMGALNGTFIALFVFSQNLLQGLHIVFPNGDLAKQSAVPLIIVALIIAIIAIAMHRQAASAPKK